MAGSLVELPVSYQWSLRVAAKPLPHRLSFNVQAAQEAGHDLPLGGCADNRDRHDQLARQAAGDPLLVGREDELGTPVEALGVCFGREVELPGFVRVVDLDLLTPGEAMTSKEATRQRVETPDELVAEDEPGFVSVAGALEKDRSGEVGKIEGRIKVRI